jgi:hypothetical protein
VRKILSIGFLMFAICIETGSFAQTVQEAPRAEHSQDVWQGLTWGMTKADIFVRLPQARDFPSTANQNVMFFGLPRYDVAGCPAQVVFQFEEGRLTGIGLIFETFGHEFCGGSILDGLNSRYGRSLSDEKTREGGADTRYMHWVSPISQIFYNSISQSLTRPHRKLVSLSVTYRPRSAGAASRL